eukprot:scaffold15.g4216.t1
MRQSRSSHWGSRSMVRGSVRGDGGGGEFGLPFERVVVIDEDGRDRTPKPLTGTRSRALEAALWGAEPADGGGSRRASIRSCVSDLPAISSLLSALASSQGTVEAEVEVRDEMEARDEHLDALQDVSAMWAADLASPGEAAASESQQPPQRHPHAAGAGAPRRAAKGKGVQCSTLLMEHRGSQVEAWELEKVPAPAADTAAGTDLPPAAAAEEDDLLPDAELDAEAMEAMQAAILLPQEDTGFASRRQTELHSTRVSMAGGHRASMAGGPRASVTGGSRASLSGSSRVSMQHSDSSYGHRESEAGFSTRGSVVSSHTSFSTFLAPGSDGRGSIVGGRVSTTGALGVSGRVSHRASVMGGGRAAQEGRRPAPSPAEVAALAEKRRAAEMQRALARLPGLLDRLALAERAVLLNTHHKEVAKYMNVQPCMGRGGGSGSGSGSGGTGAGGAAPGALGGLDAEAARRAAALADEAEGLATPPSSKSGAGAGAAGGVAATASTGSGLELLWSWSLRPELAGELPVSCLAWNRSQPSLLAVGYGRLQYSAQGCGLVAVYSMRNPAHPFWHVRTPCGVSALDFGPARAPGQLAVGFFDGSLALYDARGRGAAPTARAPPQRADGGGGHADPVTALRFVPRGAEGEEALLSVSSDGLVAEWKQAQGLERVEVVRLKRRQGGGAARGAGAAGAPAGEERPEGTGGSMQQLLGTHAGGTCFEFSPEDPRAFLVGTEDGAVLRCSTTFSEAMQAYRGHVGAVYQVCWSPWDPAFFLSCSSDGSVRLWAAEQSRPLWSFQPSRTQAEVADVQWCPQAATAFAACAGNTLQLWDVAQSMAKPRATATRYGIKLSALRFSPAAPVLACGADDGSVAVYSVAGLAGGAPGGGPAAGDAAVQQRQRLRAALCDHVENRAAPAD